jgi:hypothetical protein
MPGEAIAGVVGFGLFFTMWVLLPSYIQKRRKSEKDEEIS